MGDEERVPVQTGLVTRVPRQGGGTFEVTSVGFRIDRYEQTLYVGALVFQGLQILRVTRVIPTKFSRQQADEYMLALLEAEAMLGDADQLIAGMRKTGLYGGTRESF